MLQQTEIIKQEKFVPKNKTIHQFLRLKIQVTILHKLTYGLFVTISCYELRTIKNTSIA